MSIYVNVVNQKMYVASPIDELVSGSQEFVHFIFNLGDEWDGLHVVAQFRQNGAAYNQSIGDENGVFLPPDIIPGKCTLMLYGRGTRTIATTNYLTLNVDENIFVSDESVMDATDVISEIKKLKDSEHSHDNKEFLDGLDEADIHSHDNKEFLDTLTREDYDDLRSSIEYTKRLAHNHPNLNVINLLTEGDIHRHANKKTLDMLSEVDGELFIGDKRLCGVVVWHIVDDPVNVPSMDDGTLLFIVPGENGDMNYPPYYVNVLGTPVKKIAPWKPGQLWVCRGGVWYLIATANKTEYTPEEVITETVLPDGEVAAISMLTEDDVSASAPTEGEVYDADPCENVDKSGGIVEVVKTLQTKSHTHSNLEILESVGTTDDVVLMPMGEPLDLMIREDFASLQFPLLYGYSDLCEFAAVIRSGAYKAITVVVGNGESFINFSDTNASINVSTTDGLAWYDFDGETTVDAPDLTGFKIDYFETDILGITSETLEDIEGNPEVLSMYKTICRVINTSVENMGSVHIDPDVVEALPANGVRANRTYAVNLGVLESFSMPFDRSSISGGDAYAVVYLNIQQDCNIAFDADLYVGGEAPNTKAGMHKLIYNVLPNGQVSLGSLDLEAIV